MQCWIQNAFTCHILPWISKRHPTDATHWRLFHTAKSLLQAAFRWFQWWICARPKEWETSTVFSPCWCERLPIKTRQKAHWYLQILQHYRFTTGDKTRTIFIYSPYLHDVISIDSNNKLCPLPAKCLLIKLRLVSLRPGLGESFRDIYKAFTVSAAR